MEIQKSFNLVTDKIQNWLSGLIALLPNMLVAIFVMIIFYLIAKLVKKLLHKVSIKITTSNQVAKLVSTAAYLVVLTAGLIISLGVLQLEKTVTSLLAGAGILGLALSFAFQDIVTNFVSGVLISIRKPYSEGDIIESQGLTGNVLKISFRNTEIKTFQGQKIFIPNKIIYQNPLTNFSAHESRRIDLSVGVSYGDDLQKVKEVTLKAVSVIASFDNSKEVKLFYNEFGDSSINFTVNFWVRYIADNSAYMQARSDAIISIKKAFDKNGVTIPFPIRTLDFGIKGGEKLSEMEINTK